MAIVSQTTLSKADQTRVGVCACLGAALILALVFAGAGFMGEKQERERRVAYVSDSAIASGLVTERATEMMNGSIYFYDLDVSYQSPDGVTHAQEFRVPQNVFERYGTGSILPVTYIKSDPGLFYLPGVPPDPDTPGFLGNMSTIASIAAGLFGVAFLISLYAARNVGKAARPPAVMPGAPLRSAAGPVRQSFGVRRR